MTEEIYNRTFDEFVEKMRSIIMKKHNDYANNKDALSNFKYAGNITGLGAEKQCLALIATKVARLGSLMTENKTPNNESIDDTLIDLANYTTLLYMILQEDAGYNKLYKDPFRP